MAVLFALWSGAGAPPAAAQERIVLRADVALSLPVLQQLEQGESIPDGSGGRRIVMFVSSNTAWELALAEGAAEWRLAGDPVFRRAGTDEVLQRGTMVTRSRVEIEIRGGAGDAVLRLRPAHGNPGGERSGVASR